MQQQEKQESPVALEYEARLAVAGHRDALERLVRALQGDI